MKILFERNLVFFEIKSFSLFFLLSVLLAPALFAQVAFAESLNLDGGALLGTQEVLTTQQLPPPSLPVETVLPDKPTYPYQKTFLISAYYSPVEGQSRYVTGSFESDKRLNGNGIRGADGTPVFAGMIAAPKSYPFGTKMDIPGIGVVSVHDRGGAIVNAGQRNQAHDRLDIWMGFGDEGLTQALRWGRRTVEVTVHGIAPEIKENVNLSSQLPYLKNQPASREPDMFPSDLRFGQEGDEVRKLRESLGTLGYLTKDSSQIFDESTRQALVKFQQDVGIIDDESTFGAGYFGPQTRKFLQEKVKNPEKFLQAMNDEVEKEPRKDTGAFSRDLAFGDRGEDVRQLQEELQRMNLLAVEASGYYGEVTQHAVFKLQQNLSIASGEESPGAGRFGIKTRTHVNGLIEQRLKNEKLFADRKRPDEELNANLALR